MIGRFDWDETQRKNRPLRLFGRFCGEPTANNRLREIMRGKVEWTKGRIVFVPDEYVSTRDSYKTEQVFE